MLSTALDKVVTKSISINAPAWKVWETLTNPVLIKQWLSETEIEIISDFKVGGAISFREMRYGKEYEDKGVILEFDIDRVFKYSYWTKISRLADSPENYATIEFRLTQEENQTLLAVTHGNLIAKAAVEHSNFYWMVTLGVIKKLVESML